MSLDALVRPGYILLQQLTQPSQTLHPLLLDLYGVRAVSTAGQQAQESPQQLTRLISCSHLSSASSMLKVVAMHCSNLDEYVCVCVCMHLHMCVRGGGGVENASFGVGHQRFCC